MYLNETRYILPACEYKLYACPIQDSFKKWNYIFAITSTLFLFNMSLETPTKTRR